MPLVIPTFPIIHDLQTLLGRVYIDESNPLDLDNTKGKMLLTFTEGNDEDMIDKDKVVFSSQLPKDVVVLDQSMDAVAITGALSSGMRPIIVDVDNKIVKVLG